MIKLRTLPQLIKFYQCETKEQFFDEMSNCLETEINESNYIDHIEQFEKSYQSWLGSHSDV